MSGEADSTVFEAPGFACDRRAPGRGARARASGSENVTAPTRRTERAYDLPRKAPASVPVIADAGGFRKVGLTARAPVGFAFLLEPLGFPLATLSIVTAAKSCAHSVVTSYSIIRLR